MIEELLKHIPPHLMSMSGGVLYSGREAFERPSKIYILGLNPGGDPTRDSMATLQSTTEAVLAMNGPYSEYVHGIWEGEAGTHGMQPRVRHLLRALKLDPTLVPASNLIFVRSRQEALLQDKRELMRLCWPFHQAVIDALDVKVVVCFGRTVSAFVRRQLKANIFVADHQETENDRGWRSYLYRNADGSRMVADLTHPSRADWTTSGCSPASLVQAALTHFS